MKLVSALYSGLLSEKGLRSEKNWKYFYSGQVASLSIFLKTSKLPCWKKPHPWLDWQCFFKESGRWNKDSSRPESVDWGRPQGELAGASGPSIVWVGECENERKCARKPYNRGTRGEVYEVWSHSWNSDKLFQTRKKDNETAPLLGLNILQCLHNALVNNLQLFSWYRSTHVH